MTFKERLDKDHEKVKERWRKQRTDDLAHIIVRGPMTFLFILIFALLILGGH